MNPTSIYEPVFSNPFDEPEPETNQSVDYSDSNVISNSKITQQPRFAVPVTPAANEARTNKNITNQISGSKPPHIDKTLNMMSYAPQPYKQAQISGFNAPHNYNEEVKKNNSIQTPKTGELSNATKVNTISPTNQAENEGIQQISGFNLPHTYSNDSIPVQGRTQVPITQRQSNTHSNNSINVKKVASKVGRAAVDTGKKFGRFIKKHLT